MLKRLSTGILSGVLAAFAFSAIADSAVDPSAAPDALASNFKKISPQEIQGNFIKMVGSEWMLVSAGTEANYNGMTASWGGFGVWNKPVAFILVHTERHTYEFLEREDYFTLSFFDEKYRPALKLYGSKSGRDIDKAKEAGLTGIPTKPGVAYAEAKLIVVCKKIFSDMTTKNDPPKGHKLYFGEIVAVWQRK